MPPTRSVAFFDRQFRRRLQLGDFGLNPFEQAALPHLHARVLDWGCGLGKLARAAARRGCSVLALDASRAAVIHLRDHHPSAAAFDSVIAIGRPMSFACDDARRQLTRLQAAVRPGGIAVVDVPVDGTTSMDMFDARRHRLFGVDALRRAFDGWTLLHDTVQDFDARRGLRKRFATVIAHRAGG